MQVILLAAGRSNRLNPIEDKNTINFLGDPLVLRRVKDLKNAGFNNIVVAAGTHNLSKIKEILSVFKDVKVSEQKDPEAGMAGAILSTLEFLKEDEIFILSTNDVFEDRLFQEIKEKMSLETDGIIVAKRVKKYFPGGYIKTKNKFLSEIIEKPGEGNEPSDLVNIVLHSYKHFSVFLEYLKVEKGDADDRYESALDKYIKNSAKMLVLEYDGFWQAIKYPWHITNMMNYFLSKIEKKNKQVIDPSVKIASTAIINGAVHIEKNVKILDNAIIQGPVYIGENCIIANNSLVRASMIGANSVVGYSTEIARSYLNQSIWTHSNYIGDSVIDKNVSFGAGTVLGNLRFDEEEISVYIKNKKISSKTNKLGAIIGAGVRFGVNCSTSPGVKIGKNSFIGAGVLVDKDIEDEKMVLLDQNLKIKRNKKNINTESRSI